MNEEPPAQLAELSKAQFDELWPQVEPLLVELHQGLSKEDLPDLKNFFFLLINRALKKRDRDYEVARGLLWCADRDIRAYRILHGSGEYASYAFHLQQAVEKTVKAHGIYIKMLKSRELREVGHQPLSLMGRRFDGYFKKLPLSMINPDRKKAKKLVSDLRRPLPKDDVEAARLSFDKISELFARVDHVTELVRDNSTAIAMVDRLAKEMAKHGVDTPMDALQEIESHTSLTATLYILMMIVYPHEQSPRYPDREVKPWEYNPDLGIVKAFPLVDERLSAAISAVRLCFGLNPDELGGSDCMYKVAKKELGT